MNNMEPSYRRLFKTLPPAVPPAHLQEAVLLRIDTAAENRQRNILALFGILGLGSIIALFKALIYLSLSLANSGMYEYFSLLFSEGFSSLSFTKELLYTLAESLPLTALLLTLLFLFTLLASFKKVTEQLSTSFFTISLS